MIRKYDYLIVLAGEIVKKNGRFEMPEVYNDMAQGMKVRLDAAVKLYSERKIDRIIVVGGKVRGSGDKKTDVMANYLTDHHISTERIIKLPSATNTLGNAAAVKKYFFQQKISKKRIGLLTSIFHLPRAMTMFHRQKLFFEPVAAEPIVLSPKQIKELYNSQAMRARIESEIQGTKDLEKGVYRPKTK